MFSGLVLNHHQQMSMEGNTWLKYFKSAQLALSLSFRDFGQAAKPECNLICHSIE